MTLADKFCREGDDLMTTVVKLMMVKRFDGKEPVDVRYLSMVTKITERRTKES